MTLWAIYSQFGYLADLGGKLKNGFPYCKEAAAAANANWATR